MPWLSGVKAIAGILPALILVIFAGLLSLLGLLCGEGRRSYALAYADRFVDLAKVLRPVRDCARKGWPLTGQLWKRAHGTRLPFRAR